MNNRIYPWVLVGLLGSVLGASWAVAGFGIGRLSDVTGQRKLLLVVCASACPSP